ncbi:methylated-DNA--[protein]-cysteine S-methyltransferase [Sulfurospirillum sp. 1612]|uniref:methylated-DNA--[protein]-cysteine S-methyltransferase n=1 Tax=Sulfurospirillum sp. 1612 TaxID=3094835 RepID=UPI002F91FC23
MKKYYKAIQSPIGTIYAIANATHLLALLIKSTKEEMNLQFDNPLQEDNTILVQTQHQLHEYFEGKRTTFDIPLLPQGTPFQKAAWDALIKIPYGNTISYKTQALSIGKPKAIRAIGGANGANPIPIIIPCHRVIGTGGKLTGYASGLEIKKYLLDLENQTIQR